MAIKWLKWLRGWIWQSVELCVVRRYVDMNGRYVGELYLHEPKNVWNMIGASLDNLPLEYAGGVLCWRLDTRKSFLAPLAARTLRVGGLTPEEDGATRERIQALSKWNMRLIVQNRFVEHVLFSNK